MATNECATCGQHSEVIKNLRPDLTAFMNPDDGLLDDLWSLGVITHEQADEIPSKPTSGKRAGQLWNFVINQPDNKQQQFSVALDNNQQTHVSTLIRAKGRMSSLEQDRRLLYLCS
jgi:Caspase recruitment domain